VLGNAHKVDIFELLSNIAIRYFKKATMDKTSYENWERVKEALEESGNTDNFYYRRACAILAGGPDPMENLSNVSQDG
jgi:predicted HTH transcriptional regulator